MKIINCTPHTIGIFNKESTMFEAKIRKALVIPGQVVGTTLPPSGILLNAKFSDDTVESIVSYENGNVPTREKRLLSCDPIPEGDDHYIVSALFASAAKKMGMDISRLRTVSDPVYESVENPKPVGCLGVGPVL